MSINIVCGLTGSGKTYFVVRRILEEMKKLPKNFILVTNTHINLPKDFDREVRYISSPKDLLEIEMAVVVIDDAGIWFASRQWDRLDPRIQDKIINNRKDGLRVWVTTHFMEGIDKYIRLNAHQYWEAEKVMGSDEFAEKVWGIIRVKRFHPRMHDKIRRKRLETKTYLLRDKYIKLYDTYEKVVPRNANVKKSDIREQQRAIETGKDLQVRRQRGRPRKIQILTG
jgi:hypothetical protein